MKLSREQLDTAKSRIEWARFSKTSDPYYQRARDMADIYAGRRWDENAEADIILSNLGQTNVDIAVSAIAWSQPEFQIEPLSPESEQNKLYQRSALKKVWHEINATPKTRRGLKNSFVTGKGIIFTGWCYEETNSPPREGVPSNRPSFMPAEGELPTLMSGGDIMPPPADYAPAERETRVVWDNAKVRLVSSHSLFVDPDHIDLEDLHDAQYVIEEIVIAYDVFKADSRYQHRDRVKGVEKQSQTAAYDDTSFNKHTKTVTLYSYWQKDGRIHAIYADEYMAEPQLVEAWPYNYESYPYDILVYRDVVDEQMPQGQIESSETLLAADDKFLTQEIRHVERLSDGKLAYDETKIDKPGRDAMLSGGDGATVPVMGPPSEVFSPLPHINLPNEFYAGKQDVKDRVSINMGVDDYRQGKAGNTRRTKGEVELTVQLAASRSQLMQTKYEEWCARIAKKLLSLLQDEKFCDRMRWMNMTGDQDGQAKPVQWNYRHVLGECDVKVVCNSTRVQTPESQQSTWGFYLQSLAPYVQAGLINPAPILKRSAQSFNLTPQEANEMVSGVGGGAQVQQAVDMLGQQIQEVAQFVQQLAQTVQEVAQKTDMAQFDAKTQLELAKMRQEMAFKEEEHALDMQIQQAKADSDIAIKREQAQLNAQVLSVTTDEKIRRDNENARVARDNATKTAEAASKAKAARPAASAKRD